MFQNACMKPYIAYGDVAQCRLDRDHEGTCEEANRRHRVAWAAGEVLREMKAEAWEEGWRAAWSPMSMHNLNDGPNPYTATDTADPNEHADRVTESKES